MNMLNQLREWLDDKTCQELDDRQLARKIKTAYRQVETPTPPDELFARIRARAENTPQLPSLEDSIHKSSVATATASKPQRLKLIAILKVLWNGDGAAKDTHSAKRSHKYRENYRLFMDYALQQMRTNFVDAGMHLF